MFPDAVYILVQRIKSSFYIGLSEGNLRVKNSKSRWMDIGDIGDFSFKDYCITSHMQPHFKCRLYNYYACGLDRQTKPGTCLNSCEIVHLLCFHFWVKSDVQ